MEDIATTCSRVTVNIIKYTFHPDLSRVFHCAFDTIILYIVFSNDQTSSLTFRMRIVYVC